MSCFLFCSRCPWSANAIYLSLPPLRSGFWPYSVNKATQLIRPLYFGPSVYRINGVPLYLTEEEKKTKTERDSDSAGFGQRKTKVRKFKSVNSNSMRTRDSKNKAEVLVECKGPLFSNYMSNDTFITCPSAGGHNWRVTSRRRKMTSCIIYRCIQRIGLLTQLSSF